MGCSTPCRSVRPDAYGATVVRRGRKNQLTCQCLQHALVFWIRPSNSIRARRHCPAYRGRTHVCTRPTRACLSLKDSTCVGGAVHTGRSRDACHRRYGKRRSIFEFPLIVHRIAAELDGPILSGGRIKRLCFQPSRCGGIKTREAARLSHFNRPHTSGQFDTSG